MATNDRITRTIFPLKSENPMEAVKGPNSTFNTGIDDMMNNKFDRLVVSHSYIYWISLPKWFDEDEDLKFFKAMSQKNFRAFQGLSNMSLSVSDVSSGFAGNQIPVVTGIDRNNTQFSIEHWEYSGSPMRKMYEKWISYIRDPRTGISTYGKLFGVDYGAANHSGELIYIVTRPDANNSEKDIVEYAIYYSNVVPTEIPTGMYNTTIGEADVPTVSMEFRGVPETGPYVEQYARKILKEEILTSSDKNDTEPKWLDSFGTDEDVRKSMVSGRHKDIFNPYAD